MVAVCIPLYMYVQHQHGKVISYLPIIINNDIHVHIYVASTTVYHHGYKLKRGYMESYQGSTCIWFGVEGGVALSHTVPPPNH